MTTEFLLDPHACDRCGAHTELYHNDPTGLSLCDACDAAAWALHPIMGLRLTDIDRLMEEHQVLLAVCVMNATGNGGDFGFLDEVAAEMACSTVDARLELAPLAEAGFLTIDAGEWIGGNFVEQITAGGADHWGDRAYIEWAARLLDEDQAPAPGTPDAARAELDRRAFNKAAKRNGDTARIEAASDWAFAASGPELKALAAGG